MCEDELFKYLEHFELSSVGFCPVQDVAPAAMHPLWVVARVLRLCGFRLSCAG